MTKRPGVEKKHQKPSCESEALHFLLAPPCFGYRESVRRCRVFVVGPGLFVSLSVFVVSFRSLVVGGRLVVGGWWLLACLLGWLLGCLVAWLVGWSLGWLVGCLVALLLGWLAGWLVSLRCSIVLPMAFRFVS